MNTKQSNQQRVNELAKAKGVRIQRFTGYVVRHEDGFYLTDTLDEAEIIIKDLPSLEK